MKFAYIISFFLFISCTSLKDKIFVVHKDDDIGKKFGVEDEKLKKFAIKKIEASKKEKKEDIASAKTNREKIAKKDIKKVISKKVSEVKEKSKKIKRKPLVIDEPKKKENILPEDYPEEFKKYDEKSKKGWSLVKPYIFIGEEFTFRVSYLGITAGHIRMETKPMVEVQGKKAYRFKAYMRSSRYYDFIYSLDDSLESVVLKDSFLPVKYSLIQRESKQDVDDLQLFDHEKRKTYVWYKKIKKGKEKKLEFDKYIPGLFQDSYSSLYFVRGLPLKIGDVYDFPVVTRGKVWLLTLKVEKKETIDVNGEDVEAYRINAETRFPGVLKKKGDIIFWYSTDSLRRLLKFNAKIKIGSVEGELVEFSPGEPVE